MDPQIALIKEMYYEEFLTIEEIAGALSLSIRYVSSIIDPKGVSK